MFYHGCRTGGCSIRESTILYVGVRIGAWRPFVAAWRATAEDDLPRTARTATDERIQSDFRLIAERVLNQPETDDPVEIERRTDEAVIFATAVDLRLR